MEGNDDFLPQGRPPGPVAVQLTAPLGGNRPGRKRSYNACYHKEECRWCRKKDAGKCKRLPEDCTACEAEHGRAAKAQAAAAGSSGGGSTLPPTSPMALRPKKKTRVEEEEEEEEEMEDQEEKDEEEEEVRVLCLNPEDMRDYRGELARQQVFWAAYEALLPPEEGGLSRFWIEKFEGMERAIKALRKRYCYFVRCVFLSIFFFISYSFSSFLFLFYFIFSNSSPSSIPPTTLNTGEGRENKRGKHGRR